MKKRILLFVILVIVGCVVGYVYAEKPIKLYVDGKRISFSLPKPTKDKQNRVLVSAVPTAKALGLKVSYRHASKKATFTDGETTVVMQKGKKTYTVNGKRRKMDTEPVIVKGRMLVPVRFLAEAYGANVTYHPKKKAVYIVTKKKPAAPKPPSPKPTNPKPSLPPTGNPSDGSGQGGEEVDDGNKPVDVQEVTLPTEKKNGCYIIRTVGQLQAMKLDLAGCYVLGGDIDASFTKEWNGGKGFEPVGNGADTFFAGSLDGQGYSVKGLFMNRPNEEAVGLLNASGATIEHISFAESDVTGRLVAGTLAGRMADVNVSDIAVADSTVKVDVRNDADGGTGGVVGFAEATSIQKVRVSDVVVSAGENGGGVVGYMKKTTLSHLEVENAEIEATVDAGGVYGYEADGGVLHHIVVKDSEIRSQNRAGGVGSNATSVNMHAIDVSDIHVQADRYAAGVVAEAWSGTIEGIKLNHATIQSDYHASGVLGDIWIVDVVDVQVDNATVHATVKGAGVIGYAGQSTVEDVNASNIRVEAGELAGGVIGSVEESALRRIDIKKTTVQAEKDAGGVAAEAEKATVRDISVSQVGVTATGQPGYIDSAGGVFGYSYEADIRGVTVGDGLIKSVYSAGGVVGYMERGSVFDSTVHQATVRATNARESGYKYAGGIAGIADKTETIADNRVMATVEADYGAGGVAGLSRNTSFFRNSVAANVKGGYIGNGLSQVVADKTVQVAENSCHCEIYGDTYASMIGIGNATYPGKGVTVAIRDSYFVGSMETNPQKGTVHSAGLLSMRQNTPLYYTVQIDNAYASFSYKNENGQHLPLLQTNTSSTVSLANGYYNGDRLTGSLSTSSFGIRKTDGEMKRKGTFVGFDFANVWAIHPDINSGMPYLRGSAPLDEDGESIEVDYLDVEEVKLPTETDANGCYVIRTVGQLQAMKVDLDACYVLGGDIDATYTKEWNGGKGFEPVGTAGSPFTGQFDGIGYMISDLTILREGEHNVGLFGYGTPSSVRHVTMKRAHVQGNSYVGAVIGRNNGTGFIGNVTLRQVNVTGKTLSYVGGVAGLTYGSMNDNYVNGKVSSLEGGAGGVVGVFWGENQTFARNQMKGEVEGMTRAGGLVNAFVTDADNVFAENVCYCDVLTKGPGDASPAGGLIANYVTITSPVGRTALSDSYLVGSVKGEKLVLGIGRIYKTDIRNVYLSADMYSPNGTHDLVVDSVLTPGHFTYAGIFYNQGKTNGKVLMHSTGLTNEQMKQREAFSGFDFDRVWAIHPAINNGMPYLRNNPPRDENGQP